MTLLYFPLTATSPENDVTRPDPLISAVSRACRRRPRFDDLFWNLSARGPLPLTAPTS